MPASYIKMPARLPMNITTYTFIVISLSSETFWRHRKTVFFSQCHKSTDTHTPSFTFISGMKCWLYMYSIRGQIIMSQYFHIRKESIIISIVLVKFSTIVRWMNKIPSEKCHENTTLTQRSSACVTRDSLRKLLFSKLTPKKFVESAHTIASPQTSFGVRLSRIHFSPTDVC